MEDTSIAVNRASRDLMKAAATLSDTEARFLVDAYYIQQADRIRSNAQTRELEKAKEPNELLSWLAAQSGILEVQIKKALDKYTNAHVMGSWMRDIYGVGPIISAGFLAHIDIKKAPTAGHIWRFAGLDPTTKWEKGMKRPWNAQLKNICWHAGQSFMKFSSMDACYYGKIYKERKQFEVDRNVAGRNKEMAIKRAPLFKKTTEAFQYYISGIFPPAHIDAMARRYAVKLFISHLHEVWYERHFGVPAPLPYPIAILGHAHKINPINK